MESRKHHCPFCGEINTRMEVEPADRNGPAIAYVQCHSCNARGPTASGLEFVDCNTGSIAKGYERACQELALDRWERRSQPADRGIY